MINRVFVSIALVVIGSALLSITSMEIWGRLLLHRKHKASLFIVCGTIGLLFLSYGVYSLNMITKI